MAAEIKIYIFVTIFNILMKPSWQLLTPNSNDDSTFYTNNSVLIPENKAAETNQLDKFNETILIDYNNEQNHVLSNIDNGTNSNESDNFNQSKSIKLNNESNTVNTTGNDILTASYANNSISSNVSPKVPQQKFENNKADNIKILANYNAPVIKSDNIIQKIEVKDVQTKVLSTINNIDVREEAYDWIESDKELNIPVYNNYTDTYIFSSGSGNDSALSLDSNGYTPESGGIGSNLSLSRTVCPKENNNNTSIVHANDANDADINVAWRTDHPVTNSKEKVKGDINSKSRNVVFDPYMQGPTATNANYDTGFESDPENIFMIINSGNMETFRASFPMTFETDDSYNTKTKLNNPDSKSSAMDSVQYQSENNFKSKNLIMIFNTATTTST